MVENMPQELKVHVSKRPTVRMHSAVQPLGSLPGVQWLRPYTVSELPPPTKDLKNIYRFTKRKR